MPSARRPQARQTAPRSATGRDARTVRTPGAAAAAALAGHLQFSPDVGHIRLFDQRMLLMHADSFAELRRELIVSLGLQRARALLTRLGYQQGFDDGQRLRGLYKDQEDAVTAALSLGPRLREMEGFVRNQPIEAMRVDIAQGEFFGDYFWTASWEAQAHLAHHGVGGCPACWLMVGYADGCCTSVTGLPIHWREVECVAMGHARCRVIGRPLAEWESEDADGGTGDDTEFLRIDSFVGTPGRPPAAPPAPRSTEAPAMLRDARRGGAGPVRRGRGHDRAPFAAATPQALADDAQFAGFVGTSAGFKAAAHLIRKVAPTDSTVLLRGESGVGKECFARALHAISPRAAGPFIAINCAAIPPDLVEAELFGVERGAYTGADRTRPGRFERAHGGTLFLDEITSLGLPAQGKVLRALQEREFERVGGHQLHRVDVRIVAAANLDLRDEVAHGRFRRDLFYRLNVFPVEIPPLRERLEDIPLLVALFLERSAQRCGRRVPGLTARAHAALWDYDWPGNVRELENMIERGVILADDDQPIDVQHLFAGGEVLRGGGFSLNPRGELVRPAGTAQGGESDAGLLATPALRGSPHSSAESPTVAWPAPERLSPGAADMSSAEGLCDRLLDAMPSFEAIEAMLIDRAAERCDGNVSAVARLLQLRRGQVDYRMKKHAPRR